MAITTTGYQTPATSREGLKPSVYDKIILIGPDETPILSIIGTSDVKGIEHSWLTDTLAAEVYENDVRTRVAVEIKAKNEIEGEGWTMRDGGEANLEVYEGNGVIDFSSKIDDDFLRANATELEPSSNLFDFLAKTKNNPSRDKILNHFADKAGERDSKALDHRMAYLNYIMPTIEEPLIKIFRPDGRISNIKPFVFTNVNSKTKNVNFLSIVTDKDGNIDFITAYALKDKSQLRSEIKKGIKVEVRRGLARTFDPHSRVQVPSATDKIISQKGNLVNEAETNGLRDSVSSVGDNASRAGGRQAGDEQILRQGRRDTANASQTKRPAQSDEQVEQQWAAKADGEADAAAAGEQVVEKQGGGNNEVARRFTIDDAINAKLNFINENNLGKEGWLDKLNAVIKKYDLKEAETKNEFMGVMIRDRFKYGREFDFPSINDVMPKISPLKPQYHEILNGAHKELNEILKDPLRTRIDPNKNMTTKGDTVLSKELLAGVEKIISLIQQASHTS